MEQEEIVYVLIDGSINLLWKINFTNVLVTTKMKWKTLIILCYHINYGGCIEEPREDKKKVINSALKKYHMLSLFNENNHFTEHLLLAVSSQPLV